MHVTRHAHGNLTAWWVGRTATASPVGLETLNQSRCEQHKVTQHLHQWTHPECKYNRHSVHTTLRGDCEDGTTTTRLLPISHQKIVTSYIIASCIPKMIQYL